MVSRERYDIKRPLIPAVALAAGILLSRTAECGWWVGIIPIGIAIVLYLWLLRKSSTPVAAFRIGKWHIVWVILLFAGIGIIDESMNRPTAINEVFGKPLPESIKCQVEDIQSKTYGDRMEVSIFGTGSVRASLISEATSLSPGDIVSIPSRCFRHIDTDTSSFVKKSAPFLKSRSILYTGRVNPKEIVKEGESASPKVLASRLREKMEIMIERSSLAHSTAGFINAILLGDKTGIDHDIRLTFAHGGIAHMLALSGLHLGILAVFFISIAWPLKLAGRYKWGYLLAIVLLWSYVIVTGMAYSAVRACIMATFAFSAIIMERKNFAGSALCSSCLLILLFDPGALFDAGFQLSVVCVGALILFATPLNPVSHRHHPVLYNICGGLIATLVATAASWVLTSYYFNQIPLMFLPANFILLPLLPIYLGTALFFLVLLAVGIESGILVFLLDKGYDFFLWAVDFLSGGNEYVVEFQIPAWGVWIWFILLIIFAFLIRRYGSESID